MYCTTISPRVVICIYINKIMQDIYHQQYDLCVIPLQRAVTMVQMSMFVQRWFLRDPLEFRQGLTLYSPKLLAAIQPPPKTRPKEAPDPYLVRIWGWGVPHPPLPYPTLPYPTLPYPTLPYHASPYHTIHCHCNYHCHCHYHIRPYHTISCHLTSDHTP